ncbi:MAG: hypothetical protein QOE70_4448 [Chthoniobacter sp.]|jgi:hypothetical protein|nr:hypothetical protein [Chthoniobacter sp.]
MPIKHRPSSNPAAAREGKVNNGHGCIDRRTLTLEFRPGSGRSRFDRPPGVRSCPGGLSAAPRCNGCQPGNGYPGMRVRTLSRAAGSAAGSWRFCRESWIRRQSPPFFEVRKISFYKEPCGGVEILPTTSPRRLLAHGAMAMFLANIQLNRTYFRVRSLEPRPFPSADRTPPRFRWRVEASEVGFLGYHLTTVLSCKHG